MRSNELELVWPCLTFFHNDLFCVVSIHTRNDGYWPKQTETNRHSRLTVVSPLTALQIWRTFKKYDTQIAQAPNIRKFIPVWPKGNRENYSIKKSFLRHQII